MLAPSSASLLTDPSEIGEWLEWAGARLLALNLPSAAPSGYKSNWPEYAPDARIAYGYSGERLRAPKVTAPEIALMDKMLALPSLVPDITLRRIIHARALVTPVGNRYLYSWTKLAQMLHTERRRVAQLHERGLIAICQRLPSEQAYVLRETYTRLCT